MSQENVEIVQRALEAFEQRGLDATLRFYDAELIWQEAEDEPEAEAKQKPASKSAKAKSAEPKPQEGALAGMLRRWLGSS